MKRATLEALVAIGLVASIAPALAETTASELTANDAITLYREEDGATIAYLNGILNGLGWANARRRIFCLPPKLALTQHQNVSIMVEHIRQHPEQGDVPVGLLMLVGLKETFPCE